METPSRVFRYRMAPELRFLLEVGATVVWVATVVILREPSHDFIPALITLPIATLVGFFAFYLGRLTRFEKIELFSDRLVWTDLWRREHTLPLHEVQSVEIERVRPFGHRYCARGEHRAIRFYSFIQERRTLMREIRRAMDGRPNALPLANLPWPGKTEYRSLRTNEWIAPVLGGIGFAVGTVLLMYNVLPYEWVLPVAILVWLLYSGVSRLTEERITIEDGELVHWEGLRERLRTPIGALRNVTIDHHHSGINLATFDTDAGSFAVKSTVAGFDDLVSSAEIVVRQRFRAS